MYLVFPTFTYFIIQIKIKKFLMLYPRNPSRCYSAFLKNVYNMISLMLRPYEHIVYKKRIYLHKAFSIKTNKNDNKYL